jgi:apolipoprotein N-acyltransferase
LRVGHQTNPTVSPSLVKLGLTLAAIGTGALAGSGFATSHGAFLTLIGFAAFAYLLATRSSNERASNQNVNRRPSALLWARFSVGLSFGIGFFLSTGYPLYFAFHDVIAMPSHIALAVAMSVFVYLALYSALASVVLLSLAHRFRLSLTRILLVAFPSVWVICEWLRATAFTGMPWATIGYANFGDLNSSGMTMFNGLSQTFGIYGRSWILAYMAGMIPLAFSWRSHMSGLRNGAVVLIAIFAGGWGLAAHHNARLTPNSNLSVALLQGNTPQATKWLPEERARIATDYYQMMLNESAQLIVLPETAFPLASQDLPKVWFDAVEDVGKSNRGNVVFGLVTQPNGAQNAALYNSIVTLGVSAPQTYKKSRLMLFGEFTPPFLSWVLRYGDIPMNNFSAETGTPKPLKLSDTPIAAGICYEDLFGDYLRAQLPEAELLLNVSNFAWFGRTNAAEQHLQMGRHRSVELGRWSLRTANSGVTAVVDHHGTVVARLPEFEKDVLRATAQRIQGSTLYVVWGDALLLSICLLVLIVCCGRRASLGTD